MIHFYDGSTPEASIMDTELLIYLAFACNINLKKKSFLFCYIYLLAFSKWE